MRISDWSSDVCSSDLIDTATRRKGAEIAVVHRVDIGVRLTADNPAYTGDHPPMFGAVDGRKNGRRKMAAAGQAEDPEPHVDVRAFPEGRAWKDHMGEARGLVELIVSAHHAFDPGQLLSRLFRIRG